MSNPISTSNQKVDQDKYAANYERIFRKQVRRVVGSSKEERAKLVNQLVKVIGDHGRGFFRKGENYARIEVDERCRIWWVDDWTQKRIYTHTNHRWLKFSHGGTMRNLVERFRDFVAAGKLLPAHIFGPWPDYLCGGDLWGYGDDMQKVRDAAVRLGLLVVVARDSVE